MVKDICLREEFEGSDGTTKNVWNKIGILIEKDEKQYIKLFHLPGEMCYVFVQKPKEKKDTEGF